MLYCTYNLLNMFWALICPSSEARDYTCVLPHMVCNALVAGGRLLRAEQQAMCPGHIASCSAPNSQPPRLYLCYCRIWCVMPWLLVVGC